MPKRLTVYSVVLLIFLMSGCSIFNPVELKISPDEIIMFVGESQEFSAVGILPSGSEIFQHNFIWELSNEIGTLSVSSGFNAVFTGQMVGSGVLTVYTYDKQSSASASIEVRVLPVLSKIVVDPEICTVCDGLTQKFVALGFDQYFDPFEFEPEWIATGDIGTLSTSSGLSTVLRASNTGSGDIVGSVVASSAQIRGSSVVTITPPPPVLSRIVVEPASCNLDDGLTQEFIAMGYDQYSNPFAFTPEWIITGDIGTLSSYFGSCTVLSASNTGPNNAVGLVTASSGSITGYSEVVVTPSPSVLSSITVVPDSCSIGDGQTMEFTAKGYDQFLQSFEFLPVWNVIGEIGTLSISSGPFTVLHAHNPGSDDITGSIVASSGSLSAAASVTVTPSPPVLSRITITPASCIIADGDEVTFVATGYDQYSQPFPFIPIWSISGGIGDLSLSSGQSIVLKASNFGPGKIEGSVTATSGSISCSSDVVVMPPPVALSRIEVSADNSSITLGDTCVLSAKGFDQYGNDFYIYPIWSSPEDPNSTFKPNQGNTTNFTPSKSGPISVNATEDGIIGSFTIMVNSITGGYSVIGPTGYTIPQFTMYFVANVDDANPKARISSVVDVIIEGRHYHPEDLTAWVTAKDSSGNLHSLPSISCIQYNDPESSAFRFVFSWMGEPAWLGLPVNNQYVFCIFDASSTSGEVNFCAAVLKWEQTEL